jgi:hypothetical protein
MCGGSPRYVLFFWNTHAPDHCIENLSERTIPTVLYFTDIFNKGKFESKFSQMIVSSSSIYIYIYIYRCLTHHPCTPHTILFVLPDTRLLYTSNDKMFVVDTDMDWSIMYLLIKYDQHNLIQPALYLS